MKIAVIGAGAIGSAVAAELLSHEEVSLVQVCDARARALQELHQTLDEGRFRSFQVEARDQTAMESILAGSDCVVGCVHPAVNPLLSALCLRLGISYCDLGGSEEIVERQIALHGEAQQRAVWIVPSCGLAPGLVNILCRHGIEQFDEAEAAHLRVGDVPLRPEPPFNFRLSWSAEHLLDDYTQPVHLIRDGQLEETVPLSQEERVHFPPPFGEMEAFCTSGGLSTLASDLAGRVRTLDYKTIRWPGHAAQMRFLLELGFAEHRNIDVRTHLTYRDVLVRRMRQRLGGAYEDALLMRVLVQGRKDGRPQTLVFEMVERYDEATGTTAMRRCTSIPTAMVALFIASKRIPGGGVAPPEEVVPRAEYVERLIGRGLPITTTWYEGYRDVTDPANVLAGS